MNYQQHEIRDTILNMGRETLWWDIEKEFERLEKEIEKLKQDMTRNQSMIENFRRSYGSTEAAKIVDSLSKLFEGRDMSDFDAADFVDKAHAIFELVLQAKEIS